MEKKPQHPGRRIIARASREQFVGRATELDQLLKHARGSVSESPNGLLILSEPLAGVSELLRQIFDQLFEADESILPIYFELPQADTTPVSAAIEFLNAFLVQYLAFRRREPELCSASLTLTDVARLSPAGDADWISNLLDAYNEQRFSEDDDALIRFCLTAPLRSAPAGVKPFVLFNAASLANYGEHFQRQILRALISGAQRFVLAGLRRDLLDTIQRVVCDGDSVRIHRLDILTEGEAQRFITSAAQQIGVSINDETRDLLAQQLEGKPFFIKTILQAAGNSHLRLDSYMACERLYVDELMGGLLHRYMSSALEQIAPEASTRTAIVHLLCEAPSKGRRSVSFETFQRRLGIDTTATQRIARLLHVNELANWDGARLDLQGTSNVWRDWLTARFRLDALNEPRALVVADVIAQALKRAPQNIARAYRRAASLPLRRVLGAFNSQLVPAVLFNNDDFATAYKGAEREQVATGLEADRDLLRLPQVFHATDGVAFEPRLREFGEENCAVAHGFDSATYTDANEIVWLTAKLESKLEADVELVETWLKRLNALAMQSGFLRTQVWLIANEGFTSEANALLRRRNVFSSSKEQFELLAGRLGDRNEPSGSASGSADEFVFVLPMGEDNELLAATTVEQVARRLNFTPEAINQIKTAVVEACINASEHSLSHERKIYQRFRVEDDKLVITISSRGILPANISAGPLREDESSREADEDRRGWGLKLIRTLMDEVEFERVDEGTSLRMTKYLRKSS